MNVQSIGKAPDPSSGTAGQAGSSAAAPSRSGATVAAGPPAAVAQAQTSTSRIQASPEQMKHVSDMLNREIGRVSQTLRFSVDQETGKTVIKVLDSSTDEVIRQIPSEEAMNISKALDHLQGLLIKGKA